MNIDITGNDGSGSGVKKIVYTTDGTDPTTSGTATTVNAATASFQLSTPQTIKWFAVDELGNASSVQSVTLQIDGTPPTAPTGFTFSSPSHAYWPGSGSTVFFQGGVAGGFTVAATGSTDPESGVSGYNYPSLGTGWTNTGGAYSFDGTAGTQSGSVTAENNAGLASSGTSFTAQADSSAPTSSVTCNTVACSAGWYTSSPVAISIAAGGESGASGVERIVYTTNGSAPAINGSDVVTNGTEVDSAAANFNIVALGTTTVKWIAEDNVGNVSSISSQTVKLDTTAPNAPTLNFTSGAHSYYSGSGSTVFFQGGGSGGFTVNASGSADADSGLAGYTYPSLGSGWSNTNGVYSFNSSAATQSGSITAQNNAGLSSGGAGFTAQADGTNPTASISCNSAACSAGWYTSKPVSIAINASDAGSGVQRVVYTTDGSAPAINGSDVVTNGTAVAGSSATFNVSAEGTTTIEWIAEDNVGNITAVGTQTVKIDTIPPTTSIGAKPSNPSNVAAPTFGFSSTEAGSTFQCSLDGGAYAGCASPLTLPTLGEGPHTFHVRATDLAGNVDPSPAGYSWTIDTVPPSASMNNPGSHLSGTVSLSSTSTDVGGTGVASSTFEYSTAGSGGPWTPISSSSWNTKTGPDAVADGLYDLHVVAVDNAGNSASSTPITNVRIDNTAPAVTITSPLSNSGIANTVSLTATVVDADPSPAVVWEVAPHGTTSWQTVPASWNTKTGPNAVADGQYDIRATATDWAGNVTVATPVTNVTVDNHAPTVSVTAPVDGGYVNASDSDPSTVKANAADAGTGVQQVDFYECTDATCSSSPTHLGTDSTGSAGVYSASWPLPADGSYWIEAVATDMVGHTSSSIAAVTVDRTAPDTTIVTKPGDPTNAAHPTFTFSASEPTQKIECNLDGGGWTTCTSPHSLAVTPIDGSHTMQIRAVDLAGNVDASPASWTWHEDNTAPTATLTDPAAANAAHAIRGTVALSSTTGDPTTNGYASGVDPATLTYQYSADGVTWATIANPAAWDTTAVTDGIYRMQVLVTDFAGNTTTSATVANVKIDNTPPVTSQDDPGQYLRATINLTGTAADPLDPQNQPGSGVDHVDFQVSPAGANTWSTVGTSTGPAYSASFDTTTLTDGHYDFRTVAYDVAGNQTASTVVTNRLVDNTPPVVQIVDPGANLRGTVLLATNPAGTNDPGANASGIVSTSYEISGDGGATWQPVGASWNTTGVTDGLYDVRATVTDAAGNVSTPSVVTARRVDNTPPVTTASGVPAGYSATDVTVTLNPTDGGSGVSDTLYSVDNGPTQHGTSVLIPAPSNGSNDGSHTISFQSVDVAGNVETQHSVVVQIDATPPACPSCSASDYYRGTVTLSATPTSLSGIASVAFQYSPDGITWTTIGTDSTGSSGTYSTSWDTTVPGDGAYHLRAQITDNASNVSTIDLHPGGAGVVVVDNTAPTAAVGSPAGGSFVSGSGVGITASASDANPLTYAFLVNGSVVASGASPSATWDSTSVGDGPVSIQVRATDPAGNSTTSAPVTVNVDNHAPTPTVNNPGAAVSGTPTISATSDADTATVEFEYRLQGGSSWTSIGTVGPPFSIGFNTGSLTDGTYELHAIATDQAGHTGTSPIVTVVVDNTNPTGSLTSPLAGQTIGGPSASLTATASDGGSGVANVRFEYAPTGTNSWTPIATVGSAPYQTSWNASAVPTANYDLRLVITDNAGNVKTTAPVTVHVDSTAPTVVLTDPGTGIFGTVPLTATTSGPAATSVTFQVSPTGANTWQTISVDNASPWSANFDTTTVPDGVYDIRALAIDGLGNQGTNVRAGVRIDNTAPSIVSSVPSDGAVTTTANSIAFDTSEDITLSGVTLDGNPTVAPTITGTHVDLATGALSAGPHTLAGTLTDAVGKQTPFRLHVTVFTPSGSGPTPYVEKNASLAHSTTVDAADGDSSMTMPANAWTGGNPSDWLVIRVAPELPSAAPAAPMPLTSVVDASAYWALAGGLVHSFTQPLDIQLDGAGNGAQAATYDGTSWRMIQAVPTAGQLPAGWTDGYWTSGTTIHILTRHLSLFALTQDSQAPTPPVNPSASVNNGNLTIYWSPGTDNSGSIANYVFFVDGKPVQNLGANQTQYTVGPYDPTASHTYSIVEVDAAGNASAPLTVQLVPNLVGLSLEAARAALLAAGFTVGDITVTDANAPDGTVVAPANLTLAAPGSAIALQLAGGGSNVVPPKWGFGLIGTGRLPLAQRKFIGVRFASNSASTFTVTLLNKKHKALKTWHFQFRAGIGIRKLYLPAKARHVGWYSVRWSAVSGTTVLHRTFGLQIVKSIHTRLPSSKKPVYVVMAGTGLPHLPAGTKQVARLVAASDQAAWNFTADPKRSPQVIVVDVDQYGVRLVHNLHLVFPMVKIIAVSSHPSQLARAKRFGATVVLSKKSSPKKIVKIVSQLAQTSRYPQTARR